MAHRQDIPIRRIVRKLFPAQLIQQMARETGAVVRQRKVDISVLFWTVVLGFAVRKRRTLAALRRAYEKSTGQSIEESSFYERITKGFAKMMRQAVTRALDVTQGRQRRLHGALAAFRDVVLTDATVVRLHEMLAKVYPGTRTNQAKAALKLHVVMSVNGVSKQSVRLTGERTSDGQVLKVGPWVKARLLMFDLGYFKYQLFARIVQNAGFFVSRLKSSANPLVVGVNRCDSDWATALVGHKLHDVLPWLEGDALDLMVALRFQRGTYHYCVETWKFFPCLGKGGEVE